MYSVLLIPLDERHELVVRVVGLQPQHTLPQPVVPAQRLRPRLGGCDKVFDDGGGNVVRVERRLQRAAELPRLRHEPVALEHAVVHGCIRVGMRRERVVKGVKRRCAIRLMAVRLQQRVVLPVRQRDLSAIVKRNLGVPDVGIRQHRVDVVRRVAESTGQRQQVLARFVQHVLLLVIDALDGESVYSQRVVGGHPAADRLDRNPQQLRREPRASFGGFREQNLHALPPTVRVVVALILVVRQAGVIPEFVGKLA